MLTKLEIIFEKSEALLCKYKVSNIFNIGSKLQAILMSSINSDYADLLHINSSNKFVESRPYTQWCHYVNDELHWIITTITEEARTNIIPALMELEQIHFDSLDITLNVKSCSKKTLKIQDLMDKHYLNSENKGCLIRLDFYSPTIFAATNTEFGYLYMPDTFLIFKSLLDRYSFLSGDFEVNCDETLEYVRKYTTILHFNIKTVLVSMGNEHKCNVPAVMGNVYIKCLAKGEYCSFIKILAELSEFTGIGIHTARGLGGCKISFK